MDLRRTTGTHDDDTSKHEFFFKPNWVLKCITTVILRLTSHYAVNTEKKYKRYCRFMCVYIVYHISTL